MQRYQDLSDSDIAIIANKYYTQREHKTTSQAQPTITFVAAQPGAGKSVAAELSKKEYANKGGYIHVDADIMRKWIQVDIKPTSEETQKDAGRLANAVRGLAINNNRNIIEEGTLRTPDVIKNNIERMRSAGYKVELLAVATSREESQLGIYQRYERQHEQKEDNPRFVSEEYHNAAMDGFTDNIAQDGARFDRARVINRNGEILFDSQSRQNAQGNVYAALMAGRELTDKLSEIGKGWDAVKECAASRGAPYNYLASIDKHTQHIKDLQKERIETHAMENVDKNVSILAADPRYQKHSIPELVKTAYYRGMCEKNQLVQGKTPDLSAFDAKLSNRAALQKFPDVPELNGLKISHEKPRGNERSRDDTGLEL